MSKAMELYVEHRELVNKKHTGELSAKGQSRLAAVERELYPMLPLLEEMSAMKVAIEEMAGKLDAMASKKSFSKSKNEE